MTKKAKAFTALATVLVIFCYFLDAGALEEGNTLVFKESAFTAILEGEPLKNIFEEVQKETGIWFRITGFASDERVSVQFEDFSVKEGLRRILRTMNYSLLFDRDNNLIGVFVFGNANRKSKETISADLNEQMLNAAMKGDTAAVDSLVADGADVNAKGQYSGWTALILASKKGEVGLVNLLLSLGADVNIKSSVRNRTAIMEATRNRKINVVKALLAANPDLDAVDWEGYTVLMFAAVSGQDDIVDALLAHGAEVNTKNKVGSSALMMASGYPNVYNKLKEAGAKE